MTIDWWTLGFQTVNVAILIWLLGHFFWKPVAAMIAARKAATQKLSDEAGAAKATIGTLYRLAPEPRTFGELTFESPSECAIAAARGYLVKGLLAGGDVACIFGAPGAGKSLIAPHIGYMVARGEQAFGMRTKPGRVFYVAAEDLSGLRRRVAALRLRHGDATEFRVVGGVSDLLDDDSPHLQALREAISDQMPVLIFVDTLAMAFPGLEENDARSMGRVVAVARQLAEYGAAVVLIHHDTKDEGSTPRGHSILNGALDAAMHVKRDDEGIVRGRLTKNRNGACDRDIAFRIGVETLGHDEDGDPETAALVDELPASTLSMAPRLSPGQREALAILRDLEAAGDVFEEAWRDACIDGRRVSQSEEREGRKRAFNRARRDLAERRLPARLQQHLAHLSPHDLSVIDREVRDGLTELANDDL